MKISTNHLGSWNQGSGILAGAMRRRSLAGALVMPSKRYFGHAVLAFVRLFCLNLGPFDSLGPLHDREGNWTPPKAKTTQRKK